MVKNALLHIHFVVESKANMESIGVLPEPDTLITSSRIELFGLLSQSKIETEQ